MRENFFKHLKLYRKTRKRVMRTHRKDLLDKLDTLFSNNPKEYWELVEKLKSDKECFKKESSIDMAQWKDHFEKLNKLNDNHDYNDLIRKLNNNEKQEIFNELDYTIKIPEVSAAVKSLKNGKACGLSKILN